RIKRGGDASMPLIAHAMPVAPVPITAPAAPGVGHVPSTPVSPPAVAPPPSGQEGLEHAKAPIVGTFSVAPSPGSLPVFEPGDPETRWGQGRFCASLRP